MFVQTLKIEELSLISSVHITVIMLKRIPESYTANPFTESEEEPHNTNSNKTSEQFIKKSTQHDPTGFLNKLERVLHLFITSLLLY